MQFEGNLSHSPYICIIHNTQVELQCIIIGLKEIKVIVHVCVYNTQIELQCIIIDLKEIKVIVHIYV